MKAAPEDQRRLLDVQRLDNELRRLDNRARTLRDGEAIRTLDARASALRAELADALGDVEDAERELARLETDTATAQARIDRDRAILAKGSSVKDAAGLESELASLANRVSDLDTGSLEVMERLETLRARVAEVEASLAALDTERATVASEREAAVAEVDATRASTEQDRAAIADVLPKELLALYERQRDRYGFGVSLLQGGVSTASGVTLTASELADVRAAAEDDVVFDPDGETILVRTSESGL